MQRLLIHLFKWSALLEALSWFALLGTMYLKYIENIPGPNRVVGMAHGLLFMAYVALVFAVADELKWGKREMGIALVASLIPGATLYVERVMMQPRAERE